MERAPRGVASSWLWRVLWLSLVTLLSTQALDAWTRAAPLIVWAVWFTPLLILLPGLLRDRLRSVTWVAFMSLLYFVWVVLRLFAEPTSGRAQLELLAVIGLFISAGFYVRERARDLRGSIGEDVNDEE
ncbi:MAG: DUF2069 domain-containing protein [Congregibacter sp.]